MNSESQPINSQAVQAVSQLSFLTTWVALCIAVGITNWFPRHSEKATLLDPRCASPYR